MFDYLIVVTIAIQGSRIMNTAKNEDFLKKLVKVNKDKKIGAYDTVLKYVKTTESEIR